MGCDVGFDLWTFDTTNDRTKEEIILLFCLKVARGRVIGKVSDRFGLPLSSDPTVSGMHVPKILEPPKGFMTLDFRWDKQTQPLRVFMVGDIFLDPRTNRLRFEGRFQTRTGEVELTEATKTEINGPDDGDTGTGSGSQT